MQIVLLYPLDWTTFIVMPQGEFEARVMQDASDPVSPDDPALQLPASWIEQEVIGQFVESVLLKNASHVENPSEGVTD